jgi:hypothetical protein
MTAPVERKTKPQDPSTTHFGNGCVCVINGRKVLALKSKPSEADRVHADSSTRVSPCEGVPVQELNVETS